ncbi:MAG TPA: type II secretion system F family protein [Treponemataceae bacterium]|jgi:type II secretory pathway component PulF|nr:type II secretion system F family protein [Treponemataceae bacterium]
MKHRIFYEFALILTELISSKLQIPESLDLISRSNKTRKEVKYSALYILQEMSKGEVFSSAVSHNPYFSVPSKYTALFYSAEKTGSIKKSLDFVVKNENLKKGTKESIVRSAVYPCLIILISIFGTVVLYKFKSSFTLDTSNSFTSDFFLSAVFMALCILSFVFSSYAFLKESDSYVFLLAFSFFLEAGFDTFTSLLSASMQFEAGTKTRLKILQCADLLSGGVKFCEAAENLSFLDECCLMRIEYLQDTGKTESVIRNELMKEEKRREQRHAMFLTLCEPAMIICTGIYLLLLIQFSVLPVMTSFGGLL